VVDVAPGVLREQIDAALQQVGIASNLQVDGLNQRLNARKSRALEAGLGSLKAITDVDSWDWEKTNSAANRLVVVVIRVAVEIQCTRAASVESIQDRTVGNIKGIIHAGRADRKPSARLDADGYIWQNAMVNSKWTVRQFVDPLRLEAFDENITGTEEFSGPQRHVIIEKLRDLGIYKVHVGAATAGVDFESAVE
jgi:hypothetical protein